MFALIILPILVSGFIVLSKVPNERLKLHRYDGQFLYFKAAKIGFKYLLFSIVFCLFARNFSCDFYIPCELSFMGHNISIVSFLRDNLPSLIVDDLNRYIGFFSFSVKTNNPGYLALRFNPGITTEVASTLKQIKKEKIISSDDVMLSWIFIVSVLTIFFAYLRAYFSIAICILQRKISYSVYKNSIQQIVQLGGLLKDSPLDYLFYLSFCKRRPILISLSNRKVYVAVVNKLGEPNETDGPNQEISVVPVLSGYRDKDTLKITFTNDYSGISDNKDLVVVIDVSKIETASWFAHETYECVNGSCINECNEKPRAHKRNILSLLGWRAR